MGICWWCFWGWPKAIRDIYDDALAELDGNESALEYGPAHIVWAEENFDRGSVQWCLDRARADEYWHDDPEETPAEKAAVVRSLERLLLLPDEILNPVAGYDGENPDKFPPAPAQLPMVK